MNVVLDVNILFSAVMKDSTTRNILMTSDNEFFFPEESLVKIKKYESLLLQKSGLGEEELRDLLKLLFRIVQVVSTNDTLQQWEKAKVLMERVDSEDVPILATALSIQSAIIWSDDAHLTKQDVVRVFTTREIINVLSDERFSDES